MKQAEGAGRLRLDHQTTLGCVACLDGSMTVADLAEAFDQVSFRRNATEHAFLMDLHVRKFIASCLREHLPRRRIREDVT
jgi:hypothetical protein